MEHKVVYNKCFGGYSVSYLGYLYMKEYNGLSEEDKSCMEYLLNRFTEIHNNSDNGWYCAIEYDPIYMKFVRWIEGKSEVPYETWFSENEKELEEKTPSHILLKPTRENIDYYPSAFRTLIEGFRPLRHNKTLVEAVEVLGSERVSGSSANLGICTIQSNMYKIDEYDGKETVIPMYDDEIYIIADEK